MNDRKIKYRKYEINIHHHIVKDEVKFNKLKELYISLYKNYYKSEETDNVKELAFISMDIERIEYKMQEVYGIIKNRNYHKYWLENPKCTCPKMDNHDNFGTQFRHYNLDCPMHGEKILKYLKRKDKIERLLDL